MSTLVVQDPAWKAILSDERLGRARRHLSLHELRLIVDHVRHDLDDNLKRAGLVRTSQGIGGATTPDTGLLKALRSIADMTEIETDFDGFEARQIARDALAKYAPNTGDA